MKDDTIGVKFAPYSHVNDEFFYSYMNVVLYMHTYFLWLLLLSLSGLGFRLSFAFSTRDTKLMGCQKSLSLETALIFKSDYLFLSQNCCEQQQHLNRTKAVHSQSSTQLVNNTVCKCVSLAFSL